MPAIRHTSQKSSDPPLRGGKKFGHEETFQIHSRCTRELVVLVLYSVQYASSTYLHNELLLIIEIISSNLPNRGHAQGRAFFVKRRRLLPIPSYCGGLIECSAARSHRQLYCGAWVKKDGTAGCTCSKVGDAKKVCLVRGYLNPCLLMRTEDPFPP